MAAASGGDLGTSGGDSTLEGSVSGGALHPGELIASGGEQITPVPIGSSTAAREHQQLRIDMNDPRFSKETIRSLRAAQRAALKDSATAAKRPIPVQPPLPVAGESGAAGGEAGGAADGAVTGTDVSTLMIGAKALMQDMLASATETEDILMIFDKFFEKIEGTEILSSGNDDLQVNLMHLVHDLQTDEQSENTWLYLSDLIKGGPKFRRVPTDDMWGNKLRVRRKAAYVQQQIELPECEEQPHVGNVKVGVFKYRDVLKMEPDRRDRLLNAGLEEIRGLYEKGAITDVWNPDFRDASKTYGAAIFQEKSDGRAKGRMVVGGDRLKKDVDYNLTWAPTPASESQKLIIALAALKGLDLFTTDVSQAFLNVEKNVDPRDPLATRKLYIRPPEPYRKDSDGMVHYWDTQSAIYGTKQGSRLWGFWRNLRFDRLEMDKFEMEQSVFIHKDRDLTLDVQTDDFMISGTEEDASWLRNALLDMGVPISPLMPAKKFNGIQIAKGEDCYYVHQNEYITKVIKKFGYQDVKRRINPSPSVYPEEFDSSDPVLDPEMKKHFASVVGSALYAVQTRPDIAVAVNKLAKGLMNPNLRQWYEMEYLMGYLRNTLDLGFCYRRDGSHVIEAYADASHGLIDEKMKGISGILVFVAGGPFFNQSKSQSTVSLSASESEVKAVSDCVKRVRYFRTLLDFLRWHQLAPTVVYTDNEAAVWFASGEEYPMRMRHLDIQVCSVRESVRLEKVDVKHIPGNLNPADYLTKRVPNPHFTELRNTCLVKVPKELLA